MTLTIAEGVLSLTPLSNYSRFRQLTLKGILHLSKDVSMKIEWKFLSNDIELSMRGNTVVIKNKTLEHVSIECEPLLDGMEVVKVDNQLLLKRS